MQLNINTPHPDWEIFFENDPDAGFYQSPVYYQFCKRIKGYRPLLIQTSENGKLTGSLLAIENKAGSKVLPSFIRSRWLIQGNPIISGTDQKIILSHLLKKLKQHQRFILFTEFRCNLFSSKLKSTFKKYGFIFQPHLNLLLPLNNKEEVVKNISSSRKRQIKKGLQSGAVIRDAQNEMEVEQLYAILYNLYHTKIHKPLPSIQFFLEFYRFFQTNGYGKIFIVLYKEQIIGGIVCPLIPDKVIYEWYICGMDKEFPAQHPSVLATWAAIDYGINNHIPLMDFMGIGKPDTPYGVRDFKLRFGGKKVSHGRYVSYSNKFIYRTITSAYKWIGSCISQ